MGRAWTMLKSNFIKYLRREIWYKSYTVIKAGIFTTLSLNIVNTCFTESITLH